MKNAKRIVALLFTVAACSAYGYSQKTSVKDLKTGTTFTSSCGYSVPLPAVTETSNTTQYMETKQAEWDFAEGGITIQCSDTTTSISSDELLQAFLGGFRKTITEAPGLTVTSEAPLRVGVYRGLVLNVTRQDTLKIEFRVLGWDTKTFNIILQTFGGPDDLAALRKAADGMVAGAPKKPTASRRRHN